MSNLLIVGIEALAAILFFVAFIFSSKIYEKTKKTTDMWFIIGLAIFVLFLMSSFMALGQFYEESEVLNNISEVLLIIFSIIWIYIAYSFISLKKVNIKKS